jgi:hypothetical protein
MTSASADSSQSDGMTGTTRSTSVGCAQTATGVCHVGVLSPHNSKETKAILNAVRVLGHELVWIRDGLLPDRTLVPSLLPSVQPPVSSRTRHTDALQLWS